MNLLDLYCGQGGAGEGYRRAGFDVTGVDLAAQPRNPHRFIQGDALEYLEAHGSEFDLIHASPPCQAFTRARVIQGNPHADLLAPTRAMLERIGRPWVIENVPLAPMRKDVILCGTMFGLEADGWEVRRHRWFELSDPSLAPMVPPCAHRLRPIYGSGHSQDKPHRERHGVCLADTCKRAMGVEWMSRDGQTQAIPPAYTKYIGSWLREALGLG